MNNDFKVFPVLETNRLIMRKVEMADLDEILFLRSDKNVLEFISKPPATREDAEMFIQKVDNQEKKGESINWAMVIKGEPKLIGTICLWNLDPAADKAEVGYSMHPYYYGKGLMHEAMAAVIAYGFETMQVKIVEAYTHTDNVRSRNLLERHHFTRDADLEHAKVGKEEPETAVIYSLKRVV